jgi:hypothetical protein
MLSDGIVSFWTAFDEPAEAPPAIALLCRASARLSRVLHFRRRGEPASVQ